MLAKFVFFALAYLTLGDACISCQDFYYAKKSKLSQSKIFNLRVT